MNINFNTDRCYTYTVDTLICTITNVFRRRLLLRISSSLLPLYYILWLPLSALLALSGGDKCMFLLRTRYSPYYRSEKPRRNAS